MVDIENRLLGIITIDDIIDVIEQEDTDEIRKKYDLIILPVVDIENRLLGIITIDDIIDVIEQEDTEDFHRMAGISSPVEETYLKTSAFTITA